MVNSEFVGEKCVACGDIMLDTNSNLVPTWSDRHDNIVCNDCSNHCCDSGIPEGMTIYNSRIGGNLVASCATCTTIWGYWDCACELVHDCHGEGE